MTETEKLIEEARTKVQNAVDLALSEIERLRVEVERLKNLLVDCETELANYRVAYEDVKAQLSTARQEGINFGLEMAAKECHFVAQDVALTTDHGNIAYRTSDKIQEAIRSLKVQPEVKL